MPRHSQRSSNFPQIGGPGEKYQVTDKSGQPKLTDRGGPRMAWKFPLPGNFEEGSPEHIAATANFLHSLTSADPATVKRGMQWYPKVHDAVSKGIGGRKAAFLGSQPDRHLAGSGLVAALSPNMDWERSNIHALTEVKTLKSSHWDAIMAAQSGSSSAARKTQAIAREQVAGMSISAAPLGNIQKAGRIVRGEDPETVLPVGSAPKTHSFMQNIHDPQNPNFVTVDGRAFDTITNRVRPWESNRGIGGSTGAPNPPKRYSGSADVIRSVSQRLGFDPSEGQAISWEHVKGNLEMLGGTRKQGPARVGQPYFHPETGEPSLHHLGGQFGGRHL